jgi:hypothetical protein
MLLKNLFLLCLLLMPFMVGAVADWHQAQYIANSFFEIALQNEYEEQGQFVRKWPSTGIRYRYVHHVADNHLHEALSELHLRHLHRITGLPIKPATGAEAANLLIVFSREERLQDDLLHYLGLQSKQEREHFFRHSVCLGRFSSLADGTIQKAVVIIPVDRARQHAKLVSCIVEEQTQVLGLPNDSESVFPSIFNDRSVDQLLTGLDYILLKILYDQRLRSGMGKTEAMPVVQSIIADFIRRGLIESADKQVQAGGLFALMN